MLSLYIENIFWAVKFKIKLWISGRFFLNSQAVSALPHLYLNMVNFRWIFSFLEREDKLIVNIKNRPFYFRHWNYETTEYIKDHRFRLWFIFCIIFNFFASKKMCLGLWLIWLSHRKNATYLKNLTPKRNPVWSVTILGKHGTIQESIYFPISSVWVLYVFLKMNNIALLYRV